MQKMKMSYIIFSLVLLTGIIVYLTGCINKKNSPHPDSKSESRDTVRTHTPSENHYQNLRNLAFNVSPEEIGLVMPASETKVFGVIMDLDLGDAVASLISFETGDASLYLSSGGAVIGGVGHENINAASKHFVSVAQDFLGITVKTDSCPLPDKNCVKFYFMTNKGKFVAQETMVKVENNSSPWAKLFEEGNKVISELRITTDKK